MKFHLILPKIGKYRDDSWLLREGYHISFDTGVTFIHEQEDESPGWLGMCLLGFGLGISWGSW